MLQETKGGREDTASLLVRREYSQLTLARFRIDKYAVSLRLQLGDREGSSHHRVLVLNARTSPPPPGGGGGGGGEYRSNSGDASRGTRSGEMLAIFSSV